MAMDYQAKPDITICEPVNNLIVNNINQEVLVEESTSCSETDDETGVEISHCNTVKTLATVPGLDVSASSTAIGSVAITESENVHFGNKTYFNGPVTIKQYIRRKTGIENGGYVKSEVEQFSENEPQATNVNTKLDEKKITVRSWQKIILSIVGVVVVGAICSVVFSIYSKSLQDKTVSNNISLNQKADESLSVAVYYMQHIVVITLGVVLLSILYLSLTNTGVDNRLREEDKSSVVNHNQGPLQILAPGHVLRIVTRSEWLAQPEEQPLDVIQHPVPWVIIAHTATESCHTQSECILRVRLIQSFHIESRGWDDIGYNFLVGGEGSVYVGRGWDHTGAHTKGYNVRSMGIAFIGTFNNDPPPKQQVDACLKLIKLGVSLGKISPKYKLLAHRQLLPSLSPGDKIYDLMKDWPHFVSNFTSIEELY